MDQPGNVRIADWRDEDKIYDILVALHRFNNFGWGWPFRPEIVLAQIEAGTRPDPATRTNPTDRRLGKIGLIDGDHGEIAGTVGVFLINPVWFTDAVAPQEIWLFVRPEYRHRGYEQNLFDFGTWFKEAMRERMPDHPLPWPLYTGFQYEGNPRKFPLMQRLWRRGSRGRLVGCLYRVD
jgi:hypothetical protein